MIFFSYSAANFLIPLENIYFREIKWQDLAGTQHAYALRTFYSMQQLFRQIAILLLDLTKKLEYCTIASQIFPPRFFCKNSVKLTFLLKKSYTVNQFDEKIFAVGENFRKYQTVWLLSHLVLQISVNIFRFTFLWNSRVDLSQNNF